MVPKLVQACSNLRMPIYVLLELEQACTNSKKGYIGVLKNRTGLFYFLEGVVQNGLIGQKVCVKTLITLDIY